MKALIIRLKRNFLRSLAVLTTVALAVTSQATSIPLNNPSFESPVVDPWSAGFLPDNWTWEYGTYIQSPAAHQGNQGVVNLGSRNAFFRLSQNSDYAIRGANETITGQVWVRVSNLERGGAHFELVILVGGNPVITNTYAVDTTMVTGQTLDWTKVQVQYTTVSADAGQTVGIAIGSDGGDNSAGYSPSYCYLDDVSLDTVSAGGPSATGTATPDSADLFSNVFFSVSVTPGSSQNIVSVVLDGTAIGAGNVIQLISAGGNVYTNTVAVQTPTALDTVLQLPATVTDGNGLVGQAKIALTVNRPSVLTWGGGSGNWNDSNWLPYNLSGPISGANRTAVINSGVVLVDQPGGVGGISSIVLGGTGTLAVHNVHYGGYGNILFNGGTLDTYDNSSYHAYGASIISSVNVEAGASSAINNSAGSWFNLSDPASTFTVNAGAQLNVSALLAGAVASNDKLYNPSGLIKAGSGTLVLAGDNTYAGGTTVNAGKLSLASSTAIKSFTKLGVAAGATVDLNFTGSIDVSSLVLDGVAQLPGTYGATGSGASTINNTFFTGSGIISVPPPIVLNFVNLGDGSLQLSWDGTATLQSITNTLSPSGANQWVDLPDVSPVTVSFDSANQSVYYRLRQ